MSVRGVISRADKRSGNQADKVYKKRLPHESRKSETAFCVQSLFFCFVKVMENKTGTSAFFLNCYESGGAVMHMFTWKGCSKNVLKLLRKEIYGSAEL